MEWFPSGFFYFDKAAATFYMLEARSTIFRTRMDTATR
jgi:hypothetical protein